MWTFQGTLQQSLAVFCVTVARMLTASTMHPVETTSVAAEMALMVSAVSTWVDGTHCWSVVLQGSRQLWVRLVFGRSVQMMLMMMSNIYTRWEWVSACVYLSAPLWRFWSYRKIARSHAFDRIYSFIIVHNISIQDGRLGVGAYVEWTAGWIN